MISKTFNRYIWLLNTLLQHRRLTFEEISYRWKYSYLGDGKPLALRTFHVTTHNMERLLEILRTPGSTVWILNSRSIK